MLARRKGFELLTPRFVVRCAADDSHPGATDFSRHTVSRFVSTCFEGLQLHQVTSKLHRGFWRSQFFGNGIFLVAWFYGYTKVKRQFSRHLYFRHTYTRSPHPAGLSNTPGGAGFMSFKGKSKRNFKELHGLQLEGHSERALIPEEIPGLQTRSLMGLQKALSEQLTQPLEPEWNLLLHDRKPVNLRRRNSEFFSMGWLVGAAGLEPATR